VETHRGGEGGEPGLVLHGAHGLTRRHQDGEAFLVPGAIGVDGVHLAVRVDHEHGFRPPVAGEGGEPVEGGTLIGRGAVLPEQHGREDRGVVDEAPRQLADGVRVDSPTLVEGAGHRVDAEVGTDHDGCRQRVGHGRPPPIGVRAPVYRRGSRGPAPAGPSLRG